MHDPELQRQFDDWKKRAQERDLLKEANDRGAKLKRAGREWVGPCPACGGTDRFSINVAKNIFNCRGAGGGDVIALVRHLDEVDFIGACERLTGEPPPSGQSRPLSEQEKQDRERRRQEADRERDRREAAERRHREERQQTAIEVWRHGIPVEGTPAEAYLLRRGIPRPPEGWPEIIRFHPRLVYELDQSRPTFPCLVARVDDIGGNIVSLWRIFLTSAGDKAPVDNPKLGLGPSAGGAIRLGGVAKKIGIVEGLETAFGAWWLRDRRHPVWSLTSTSGFSNIELPLDVETAVIFPDGDKPRLRERDGKIMPRPGITRAREGQHRLKRQGIACSISQEPAGGRDYLDVWNSFREREEA